MIKYMNKYTIKKIIYYIIFALFFLIFLVAPVKANNVNINHTNNGTELPTK